MFFVCKCVYKIASALVKIHFHFELMKESDDATVVWDFAERMMMVRKEL